MKKLTVTNCILTLLLLVAVGVLCHSAYKANELLDLIAENLVLKNDIERLKLQQPCRPAAHSLGYEASK